MVARRSRICTPCRNTLKLTISIKCYSNYTRQSSKNSNSLSCYSPAAEHMVSRYNSTNLSRFTNTSPPPQPLKLDNLIRDIYT